MQPTLAVNPGVTGGAAPMIETLVSRMRRQRRPVTFDTARYLAGVGLGDFSVRLGDERRAFTTQRRPGLVLKHFPTFAMHYPEHTHASLILQSTGED